MKNRLLLLVGGLVLAVFIVSGPAFGAGIILRTTTHTMVDHTGSGYITPGYTGAGDANTAHIEFFLGGAPVSPISTSGRTTNFSLITSTTYNYKYDTLDGSTVVMRSWDGSPRTQHSHYGFSSGYAAASGPSPVAVYDVNAWTADWLADVPVNAPSFTSGSESNQRQGYTNNVLLSLSVSWSYSVGSAPNKIVATGYDLKYWVDEVDGSEPSDSDTNRVVSTGGTSWSLPSTDPKTSQPFNGGHYHFKARAKNDFGNGPWSTTFDWTTLSGGVSGPETKTWVLTREASGLGVNTLAVPFKSFQSPSVTSPTLNDLVTFVNSNEASNIVYSIGWWNPSIQAPEGFEIKYNSTTLNDFTATGTSGLGPLNLISIEKDRAYQMYVVKSTKFSITGSRN